MKTRPERPLEEEIEQKLKLKQGANPKMSKPRRLSQEEMVEVRKEFIVGEEHNELKKDRQ